MRSEVIDCEGCGILLRGIFFRPPFTVQMTKDAVYVNGYQFEPAPKFPDATNARAKASWDKEREDYRKKREADPCTKIVMEISEQVSAAGGECKKFTDPLKRNQCIRRAMKKLDVEIIDLYTDGEAYTSLDYRKLPCLKKDNLNYAKTFQADVDLYDYWQNMPEEDKKQYFLDVAYNNVVDPLQYRKDIVRGLLKYSSLHGYEYHVIYKAKTVLESDYDPRIKLYLLRECGIPGLGLQFSLLANADKLIEEMER